MGVSVRAARPGDAATLVRLFAALGYATNETTVAARLADLPDHGAHALVAEDDGAVVGCITTSTMFVLHRPALVGRISLLVVDEARRSAGIGALLVSAAEDLLRAQGCYMVEVTSRFELEKAHGFYERLGYAKTSVRLARDLTPG